MATVNNNGGSVELWDTRDPARPRRAAELAIDTRYTFPLAFAPVSPGGPTSGANILATGADDFSIRLWNTDNPDRPTPLGPRLVGPSDLIRSVAFSPDGSRLAVTSDDKRVYLYDLRRPGPDPIAVISDDAPVTQAVFADGGQVLVVGARDLSTWNLNGGGRPTQIDRRPEMHVSTPVSYTHLTLPTTPYV